jgi:superfamily II DNA/RNA helicase
VSAVHCVLNGRMLREDSELAYQISQQVTSLGSPLGVRTTVIVGGMDMMSQSIALSKRPHVIVATPGRLMDHLENTKGFSLKSLKYLVSLQSAPRAELAWPTRYPTSWQC